MGSEMCIRDREDLLKFSVGVFDRRTQRANHDLAVYDRREVFAVFEVSKRRFADFTDPSVGVSSKL